MRKTRKTSKSRSARLIVEQIEDNRVAPAMAQRIEVVCKHSSIALANAMEHQNLFLMPLWRAIGKSRFLVQARTLPKTVLVVVALLTVLLSLFLVPWDFDLHAKGTLEPVERRDVYTHVDGDVAEFGLGTDGKPIEQGSWVKKGQLLVRLTNPTLDMQKADIEGKIASEIPHYEALQHSLDDGGSSQRSQDYTKLVGEWTESKQKLESLRKQAKLFQDQIDALNVLSPIDGQIVTWDLQRQLKDRPVQRGQWSRPRGRHEGRLGIGTAHGGRPNGTHCPAAQ